MDNDKLNALEGLITEVDAEGPATPEQAAAAKAAADEDQAAREWGAIAYTVGGALAMVAPELRAIYTEPACLNWGRSAASVANKYGWTGPASVPEIGLLISTVGLAVPSYLAIRVRLAALRDQRQAQQPDPPADDSTVENEAMHGG